MTFDPDLSPPENHGNWAHPLPKQTSTKEEIATAVSMLKGMAEAAEKTDSKRCVWGEAMLYFPFDRALIPGHIYSKGGIDEAKISGCCEYHFDRSFEPGWVDVVTGEPGLTPMED